MSALEGGLRHPLIVALRDLAIIDKQDKNDKILPDLSSSNLPHGRGISAMTSRLASRNTRHQLSRLSNMNYAEDLYL